MIIDGVDIGSYEGCTNDVHDLFLKSKYNLPYVMIIDGVDIESYEGFYTLFAMDADLFP